MVTGVLPSHLLVVTFISSAYGTGLASARRLSFVEEKADEARTN